MKSKSNLDSLPVGKENFMKNRYFLHTKRFWDTRVCFPYVCLCLMLNQKTLDEMSIDIVRA